MTTLAQDWLKEGYEKGILEGEKKMTTLAQDWLKEGYEKGIHAGMQKGKLEGEHEKAIAIASNLLTKGVSLEIVKAATALSDTELKKLIKSH